MFTPKARCVAALGATMFLANTSGFTQPVDAQPVDAPTADVQEPSNAERLNAVLWMGTSVEYGATALQAYQLARLQLDAALRDGSWTAATEQETRRGLRRMPPAIILDIDETVLDNARYNARMTRENKDYNEDDWMKWIASPAVRPVPGAVGFTQYAHRKGVAIFYISNRSAREKSATIKALQRLGFPLRSRESVLLKGEKPQWTSDKSSRRRFVTQTHRVLLLLGDDFNDFAPVAKASLDGRSRLGAKYRAFWGSKWIVLPNPVYGSWEQSILRNNNLSSEQKAQRKRQSLQALSTYGP